MNPIMQTWERVRASRQAGPRPVRGDGASTAATGEEWVMRDICGPYRIDPDDLVRIHVDLCLSTTPNILALRDELALEDVIGAAIAAGMTNGLALGLAHGSRARAQW